MPRSTTRRSTNAKAIREKRSHPEWYCPVKGCLWKTAGRCYRHKMQRQRLDFADA